MASTLRQQIADLTDSVAWREAERQTEYLIDFTDPLGLSVDGTVATLAEIAQCIRSGTVVTIRGLAPLHALPV